MSIANPFISICIPAYKRTENIDKLLQSISIQTFKDIEIVITDDSPDDSLMTVLQKYEHLPITYYKNNIALGTPANWNFGISKVKGEWIKLMHDDDWLATERSLELLAAETRNGKKFIFSAYTNVFQNKSVSEKVTLLQYWKRKIINNPHLLLARNVIGPPSVTLIHRSITEVYDIRMKWRVDIDFYIRILSNEKTFGYIDTSLINVGISGSQVTNYCINLPNVELPEGLLLLHKYGIKPLKSIVVYDAWWRLFRNVGVRSVPQLEQYEVSEKWPVAIVKIVRLQSFIPVSVLKIGAFSKLFMLMSFLQNYKFL